VSLLDWPLYIRSAFRLSTLTVERPQVPQWVRGVACAQRRVRGGNTIQGHLNDQQMPTDSCQGSLPSQAKACAIKDIVIGFRCQ
jgi:hypothetical protein